jgi:subtilisin-like proprotein convertase family protein
VSDNKTDSLSPFGTFTGGSRIAFGNSNNTGGEELIVGQGNGGGKVKVFTDSDADRAVSDNPVLESFSAFSPSYTGGVYVAGGMISGAGNGGAEIIVGRGTGASLVKIFSDSTASNNGQVGDDPPFDSFQAYVPAFTGGVRVAAGDTDNSGSLVEVITGAGTGGNRLTIRDDKGDPGALLSDEPPVDGFEVFASGYKSGLFVAFGKVQNEIDAFSSFPQTIADSATLNTSIFVPQGAGKIVDLDVNIALFHSFDGDLDVTLTHVPTGTSVILFQDVGSSNEGFFIRLNDEAGTDISTASNPKVDGAINGTFNPGGTALLSLFDGQDASGEWRLTIVDDSGGDAGTLFGWSLAFTF